MINVKQGNNVESIIIAEHHKLEYRRCDDDRKYTPNDRKYTPNT